jgi:hypothetical protein
MSTQEQDKTREQVKKEQEAALEESEKESFPGSDAPAHEIDDEPIPTAAQLAEQRKKQAEKK